MYDACGMAENVICGQIFWISTYFLMNKAVYLPEIGRCAAFFPCKRGRFIV